MSEENTMDKFRKDAEKLISECEYTGIWLRAKWLLFVVNIAISAGGKQADILPDARFALFDLHEAYKTIKLRDTISRSL